MRCETARASLIALLAAGPATATAPLSSTYSYVYNAAGWTTGVTSTLNGVTTTQVSATMTTPLASSRLRRPSCSREASTCRPVQA